MSARAMTLKNDVVELTIIPSFGARVTSLKDRRTGREWLVTGPSVGDSSDEAVFLSEEAIGWDECFPTVAPCKVNGEATLLRDHGDLWARPWSIQSQSDGHIDCLYETKEYSFSRSLTLIGNEVKAEYELKNLGEEEIPYLYSQHMLLATNPGEIIQLSGIDNLKDGDVPFAWPDQENGHRNDKVLGFEAGVADKTYGLANGEASAGVYSDAGSLSINWSASELPYFGMWRCFGGWPEGKPVHQLALEPTTAPAHDLESAKKLNLAATLAAGATTHWATTIKLFAE